MTMHRLFRTTNFRLFALYTVFVLASFLLLGFTIYILTKQTMESQLNEAIDVNLRELEKEYKASGLSQLILEIKEKEQIAGWSSPDYLLSKDGKILAGSLPNVQLHAGWQTYQGPPELDEPDERQVIIGKAISLSNGYWLMAGQDLDYINDFGTALIKAFLWGGLLVTGLGIPGGIFMSRSFLKKIEGLTFSTKAIINGDLSHRLAVSRSNDELDGLARLINQMLDKIGTLINDVQQISNDIAHDLRTPISRLRQRLDITTTNTLSSDQYQEKIESAKDEIDIILSTFSAMLRIAQIETGSRRSGFKAVNLGALAHNVADAFIPLIQENGKSLDLKLIEAPPIQGDSELLTQLIFNLLENAVQHAQGSTNICMELSSDGEIVNFIISDNGPGIADDLKEKVFQRFYRTEQSRTTPGNGLGLSIARAIAELHGTQIILSDNYPGLRCELIFQPRPSG